MSPPCSCVFLSMRRRTESHPCVPQKGRHNHEPVQIHLSAAVSGQPVTSGQFIVAPTPKAGPHRREEEGSGTSADLSRLHLPPDARSVPDASFSPLLSAFPAFAAQLPKKNRAIWQHSDSESVFCSDAFAFSTMCPSIFFNVKAFLLAAISRFIREAAHLHPLNASQQQGPFLTQDGLFSSPISADGHRSGHHGNSPAGAAGA